MNNERRKAIRDARDQLESALGIIRDIAAEEREAFENLSEGLQASERGQAIEAAAEALESAEQSADEAMAYLEEAIA